jgi:ABC-type transport system involved in multi-copper enzyme maturation permease subunit
VTSRGILVYGERALSPAAEIHLLLVREIRRSVRSAKGIVLGVVTMLGAIVTSFVVSSLEGAQRRTADGVMSTEQFNELKRQVIEHQTGNAALAVQAASMPQSLKAFLDVTVWLAPLLIALLGFDTVSGELQHRGVRFWTVRTRRSSYFAGKLFGLWMLVALVMLVINVIAGTVALTKGYVTGGELVSWGLRFWLIAVVIAGAWASIAVLISSCFRTPVLALLTTFATFFVLWVCGFSGTIARARGMLETQVLDERMRWYEYLYPNAYESMLVGNEASKAALAVGILLGFVAVMTAAGSTLFQRRDV